MKINHKEKKHPRELYRNNEISPALKPIYNCTVKFTDIPFPPLLKRHNRGVAIAPHESVTLSPLGITRKNSIYQLKGNEDIKQATLGRILKEHRGLGQSTLNEMSMEMEDYFRGRVTNVLGKKRHIISPIKVGLPADRHFRTIYRRHSIPIDRDEMNETLLEQKELTIRKKFIETTMNSIRYERDRMQQSIRKDKLQYKRRSIEGPRISSHRQQHTTTLERQSTLANEPQRNNYDSPRRRPLPEYDFANTVDLRPWTNHNANDQ